MSDPHSAGHTRERRDIGSPELHAGALVDVVIACHTPSRPIGRAVASILDGNPEAAVTVVCHNRSAEEIAEAIDSAHRGRVRYLEHADPRPSASGPFNAGMKASRTRWVAIMGSDDRLAPGAIASWLTLAGATGAEFVVPRLALGSPLMHVPTPAPRPSRLLGSALATLGARRVRGQTVRSRIPEPVARAGARLALVDLRADRLSYRSAPLGLLSVEMLDRLGARLVEGAGVGGDVAMVTRLFAEVRVAYDAAGPAYLIGEDADDRVTYVLRPIDEQLAFFDEVFDDEWFIRLALRERQAIAIKAARIHLFGAVYYRRRTEFWTDEERRSLSRAARHLGKAAPGYSKALSIADLRLLMACLDPEIPVVDLIRFAEGRRKHGRPATILTASPVHLFDREAPLRFMTASVLSRLLPGASDAWRPDALDPHSPGSSGEGAGAMSS